MQNLAEPFPRPRPLPDWNVKCPTADSLSSVVPALENELIEPPESTLLSMTSKTSSGRKQPWVPWVRVIGHRHIQILYAKAHSDTGLEGSEESCPICACLTEGLSLITSSPSSGGVFLCSLPLCLPAALTGHQSAPPCRSHSRVKPGQQDHRESTARLRSGQASQEEQPLETPHTTYAVKHGSSRVCSAVVTSQLWRV